MKNTLSKQMAMFVPVLDRAGLIETPSPLQTLRQVRLYERGGMGATEKLAGIGGGHPVFPQ